MKLWPCCPSPTFPVFKTDPVWVPDLNLFYVSSFLCFHLLTCWRRSGYATSKSATLDIRIILSWRQSRNKRSRKSSLASLFLPKGRYGGTLSSRAPLNENKSTKTWSVWGGKVANLSQEKGPQPVPQRASTGSSLHRNTGKAHQSLSGSNNQTIHNIQRTTRAHSEPRSDSQRATKLWETNLLHAWTPIRKLRVPSAKQVSKDSMHSFLGPITPGNHPFLPRAEPPPPAWSQA